MAEADDIRALIEINKKRLTILEEQRARFGFERATTRTDGD